MPLVENYAAERNARLIRLGARPKTPPVKITELAVMISHAAAIDIPPVEDFYPNMWFHHLVAVTPIAPSIHEIQKACAAHFNVSLSSLIDHGQRATSVLPRHVALYLCGKLTTISINKIARQFDRDHATALYACKKIAKAIETDAALNKAVKTILARFQ